MQEDIDQLNDFLFNGKQIVTALFRNPDVYVLDVPDSVKSLIDFDYLENNYSAWLHNTGRSNTTDEYGMLPDFVGYMKKGKR